MKMRVEIAPIRKEYSSSRYSGVGLRYAYIEYAPGGVIIRLGLVHEDAIPGLILHEWMHILIPWAAERCDMEMEHLAMVYMGVPTTYIPSRGQLIIPQMGLPPREYLWEVKE